jgi:undecaprenyl-diphosphatase
LSTPKGKGRAWRGIEAVTVVALLLVSLGAWFFLEIADDVLEGDTREFDEAVLLAFRSDANPDDPIGDHRVEELARDVTGFGSTVVVSFLTIAVAGFLLLQRKWHLAAYLLGAVATGIVLGSLLKAGFDRPRPDLVAHGQSVYTSSFPSGHSMMSAVGFLTLGAILAGSLPSRAIRLYVIGLAALLTAAVGVSRVYLGVHWPTDVLAGWAAGTAWALACWSVARILRRRGEID